MVDRVAGGRGEDIGEGLVGAVETVDVVEHDGSTHGVMASVERMVSSHHCLSSSSSSASPSCMGHPVTVQEQIRAWHRSEILEILITRRVSYFIQSSEGRVKFITYDYFDFYRVGQRLKITRNLSNF